MDIDKITAPEYYTSEMVSFLLVNALRLLTPEQRHELTIALAIRDSLFTVDEYIKLRENP